MGAELYDSAFFAREATNSLNSARIIVPMLIDLLRPPPRSVIDVGCGMGGWLRAFAEHGATQLRGLDGDYVDRSALLIEPACFGSIDLQHPFTLPSGYDLALCLEVAEHIPAKYALRLVEALTKSAPLILFSAAIPGQKGQGHVNERWPSYWRKLFARRTFVMLDPIRPRIREDRRVMWWYRQNLLLFASQAALAKSPALRLIAQGTVADLEWIHKTVTQGSKWTASQSEREWVAAEMVRQRPIVGRIAGSFRALARRLERPS